jgi:uncharacterized protein YbjT (DUF2867 family)
MIALIIGSSGLVGGELLMEIQNHNYDQVIVLVRRPLHRKIDGVVEHVVDFDEIENIPNDIQADHIFVCMGSTMKKAGSKEAFRTVDYEYPLRIAKLFLSRNASQLYVVTANGANKSSMIFYSRVKGELEEAIQKLGYTGVSIFRPSLILGERKERRAGEKFAQILFKNLGFIFSGPFSKYKGVSARAIARAMLDKKDTIGARIVESDEIQKFEP